MITRKWLHENFKTWKESGNDFDTKTWTVCWRKETEPRRTGSGVSSQTGTSADGDSQTSTDLSVLMFQSNSRVAAAAPRLAGLSGEIETLFQFSFFANPFRHFSHFHNKQKNSTGNHKRSTAFRQPQAATGAAESNAQNTWRDSNCYVECIDPTPTLGKSHQFK